MKGFPNQIADITKLTIAYGILARRLEVGQSVDDDSYGEALLREGVISPRDKSETVEAYLVRMRVKALSTQSHRTTARGLKEFFRRAMLVLPGKEPDGIVESGETLLKAWEKGDEVEVKDHWRSIARGIEAVDNAGCISHPYQLLLRLLAARPGTPRALCAVVFDALNDSDEEFNRIVLLRDSNNEDTICAEIGVTKSNWDNAKKILPSIAEQVGDIAWSGEGLYLLRGDIGVQSYGKASAKGPSPFVVRKVSADTIAQTKSPDDSDEGFGLVDAGSDGLISLADAIAKRANRSYRHNLLVQSFAKAIPGSAELWEGEFDCLIINDKAVALLEMKTLDGTPADDVRQVRYATGQLLYYERFSLPSNVIGAVQAGRTMLKLSVFESKPSDAHVQWMYSIGIYTVWASRVGFATSPESRQMLSGLLGVAFI